MPKVIVTPNPMYNPIGVRQLLAEMGVTGPMLQDATTIKCVMSEDQIHRFRNSRGAAHQVVIVPDPPPAPVLVEPTRAEVEEFFSDDEPPLTDPTTPEFPNAGGSDSSDDSDPDPKKAA